MLTARDFAPSNEKCRQIIEHLRWGVMCIFCESKRVVRRGKDKKGFQRWLCTACGRSFNARTGTVFARSRLKLWEWFYLIKEHAAGRTIYSIAADLQRPYNTVYYSIQKLKRDLLARQIATKLKGEIEIDESYVTAGQKGSKELKRRPRRRGGTKIKGRGGLKAGKTPILAITQRA
jgi:transposase-like protein